MTADLERERARLVLAESDMKQAARGAAHILHEGAAMNDYAERALMTGVLVTYASPFSKSNKVGPVEGEIAQLGSPALGHLHDEILSRRNDLFAHNDKTPWREAMDIAAHLGTGKGEYVESHAPIDRAVFKSIEQMASEHEQRFRERLAAIEVELRTAHSLPKPPEPGSLTHPE
jgi:hypothetical protein